MKTKFITLFASMAFLLTITKAQTPSSGGTTFGLRAGVNFQNLNGKDANGNKLENKLKPGFHVGANAEIPVAPDYYIQPGLLFSTKGAKSEGTTSYKTNLSYVEVPVNFVYKPVLGTGRVIVGFGPYAAFAVGGKVKPESGPDMDIKFQNSVTASELQSGEPYAKRFDAGANFLAGYEFSNRLSFQLNAQLGLLKINPKYEGIANDKSSIKNTGFGVSAGFRL